MRHFRFYDFCLLKHVLRCTAPPLLWKGQRQPDERHEVLQAKLPRQELAATGYYCAVADGEVQASAESSGVPADHAGRERHGRPGECSQKTQSEDSQKTGTGSHGRQMGHIDRVDRYEMLCSICIVQIQPRKDAVDHADYTSSTRQHEPDHTDHLYNICPAWHIQIMSCSANRSYISYRSQDHTDHTDHTDHLSDV